MSFVAFFSWIPLRVKVGILIAIIILFALLRWRNQAVEYALKELISQSKEHDNAKANRIRERVNARRLQRDALTSDSRGYRD